MNTLDILIAARGEVEKGWGRQAVDRNGNVCALGAIDAALGGSRSTPKVCAQMYVQYPGTAKALCRALGKDEWSWPAIPHFNDELATTQADVLALYDRAINAEAVKTSSDPAHTYVMESA